MLGAVLAVLTLGERPASGPGGQPAAGPGTPPAATDDTDPTDDLVSLPAEGPDALTPDHLGARNRVGPTPTTTRTSVARGPTCGRAGCAVWRSTTFDQRPLLVTEGVAVHLGSYRLYGLDPDTGAWRWRRDHTDPRGVTPAAALTATHLDPEVLAIAYGTRVRIHAAADGRLTGDADLAPLQVTGLARYDGVLVATAAATAAAGSGVAEPVQLIGLAADGTIRWAAEVAAAHARNATGTAGSPGPAAPLVVRVEDDLRRLDPATGEVVWSRPVGGLQLDGTTLLDPASGAVEVIDPASGEVVLRHRRPGALAAGVRAGVLVVTTGSDVEVVAVDGRSVLTAQDADPAHTVLVRTGAGFHLIELPGADRTAAEPRVLATGTLGAAGDLPGGGDHPGVPTDPPSGPGRAPSALTAMPRLDGVLLADGSARRAWLLAPDGDGLRRLDLTGETGRSAPSPTGAEPEVWHRDGLSFLRQGARLRVIGAGGELTIRGATQVAGTDPLLVHGGTGTLRLDRDWLDDGPARDGRTRPLGPSS